MAKTRLDGLLHLRDLERSRARQALAEAGLEVETTLERLDAARARLERDTAPGRSAAEQLVADAAFRQGLRQVRAIEREADEARERREEAQESYGAASRSHEAVRRAVESRRLAATQARRRVEQARLDELGLVGYVRRGRS